jgi:RHS repeat-associated protein
MGRVKTTEISPDYTSPSRTGLEKLDYSFNIHGYLTGINKDYALKNPSNYNKWEHFFGIYLGFDNLDQVFNKGRLNGQVTGVVWNSLGDDAQRKYEYTYDNVGRLANADFTEQLHPGDGWSNNKMDFSVSGNNGKITYDLNGNLINMLQKGVQPGNAAPFVIDNLNYVYTPFTNKLEHVTDVMTNTAVNGQFGDFKDGSNGTAPDYVYDNNGNLVIDLNKNAKELGNVVNGNGIHYNYLDKPDEIRIAGKGTIKIVYSASGEKLQRIFTPETGDPITTTYLGSYVYEQKGSNPEVLSCIEMAGGRIRVIDPIVQNSSDGYDGLTIGGNITLPGGKAGVFDYFIHDYQQNVRMILTEETHTAFNTCTMEAGRSTVENSIFGQTGSANEVEATKSPIPDGWKTTNISASVSRLGNLVGHNLGPNTLQKVMAGDQVTASVQYYFENSSGGSNPNFVNTLLTSLGQAIVGGSAAGSMVKGNVAGVTSGLNGSTGFLTAVQPAGGSNLPQAYLTILFFDERFKFIEAADGGVAQLQVSTSGAGAVPLGLTNIKAPKNGYVYVYVSNQSDQNVYFDDLNVGIVRGNIIEENHYYAYGLKIAALSSRKPAHTNEGKIKNDYLYNSKEFFDDADLNWYDYGFRNYDPQTGRFVQVDPIGEEMPALSSYHYAYNDPVSNVDADGLVGIFCPGTSGFAIFMSKAAEATVNFLSTSATVISALNITTSVSNTYVTVMESVKVSGFINGQITSLQVGETGDPVPLTRYGAVNTSTNSYGLRVGRSGKLYESTSGWSKISRALRFIGTRPISGTIGLLLISSNGNTDPAKDPDNIYALQKQAETQAQLKEKEDQEEDEYEKDHPEEKIRYVTYTKVKHNDDGTISIYSGKTSGPASLTASAIVKARDANHKLKDRGPKNGYDDAVVDKEAVGSLSDPRAKFAIRGREQQLVDYWGGAQSDTKNYPGGGVSANKIRAVRANHPLGRIYHEAANMLFGWLHHYTGL